MGFYTDFVTALGNLTVTGVTRKATTPPRQMSTADLPYQFPRLPTAANEVAVLSGGIGPLSRATCELVILIEPRNQNTVSANFGTALTLLDNLETALASNAATIDADEWSVRQDIEVLADGTAYWALIATIRGSG